MRDGAIAEAFSKMEKMVGSDVRLLNKTVAILAMRIDAIQKLLFGGRFSLVYALVLSVFSPKTLEKGVDRIHKQIEENYNKKVREQMEKATKSVITNGFKVAGMSLFLFLFLIGTGCASKGQITRAQTEGYQKANVECLQMQGQIKDYITSLKMDIVAKTERLRKFNQVNDKGELINKEGK
jgi:hypothetical protein